MGKITKCKKTIAVLLVLAILIGTPGITDVGMVFAASSPALGTQVGVDNNGVTWVYAGGLIDSQRHGRGILSWGNGEVFIGEFINGQRHGQGTHSWPDGTIHAGEWFNNQPHGKGILINSDGDIQEGIWEDGEFFSPMSIPAFIPAIPPLQRLAPTMSIAQEGKDDDGVSWVYIGEKNGNEFHGQGIMSWSNGNVYIGEFLNNQPHSQGIFIEKWGNKGWFTGDWINGHRSGQGVWFFVTDCNLKTLYIGSFYENHQHGYGSIYFEDESWYEGNWIYGMRQGNGKYVAADGVISEGIWEKDILVTPLISITPSLFLLTERCRNCGATGPAGIFEPVGFHKDMNGSFRCCSYCGGLDDQHGTVARTWTRWIPFIGWIFGAVFHDPCPARPIFGITINPSSNRTFPIATVGYSAQTPHTVTINNTGNRPTGTLNILFSGANAFTLNKTSIPSIAVNGSDSFTITPNTGLAPGIYNATITVSGANISSRSFTVSFTVGVVPVSSITDVPTTKTTGTPLTLSGVVNPTTATNKNISWSIVNAGGTGATINGNILNTTVAGTVRVRATIINGRAIGSNYSQEFNIVVRDAYTPVVNILDVPTTATARTPLILSGEVNPSNATNRVVLWSIENERDTDATIVGNVLYTTAAGIVTVKATIINGTTESVNYTQSFNITVNVANTPNPNSSGKFIAPIDPPSAGSIPISNRTELEAIKNNLSGTYHLIADIDLSGKEWIPIGDNSTNSPISRFSGVFDGQGYVISNLTINGNHKYGGLFGNAQQATIKNVGLENTYIDITYESHADAGSISAVAHSSTNISNSYNTGYISARSSINAYAGGISGHNQGVSISNCYNKGTIFAYSITTHAEAGGIGTSSGDGVIIQNCYNTGNISAETFATTSATVYWANAGGIVSGIVANIDNCYNSGTISSTALSAYAHAGGIGAFMPTLINNSYNSGDIYTFALHPAYVMIGGIIGRANGSLNAINNTYWNIDSKQFFNGKPTSSQKGIGFGIDTTIPISSVQMQHQSTFASFDFDTIWDINPNINNGYPFLRMFGAQHQQPISPPDSNCLHSNITKTIYLIPTCTTDGTNNVTCDDCNGAVKAEVVRKLGHSWGNWRLWVNNVRIRACTRCHEVDIETRSGSGDNNSTGSGDSGNGGGGGGSNDTTIIQNIVNNVTIIQQPGITNIVVNIPLNIIQTININIPVTQLKVPAGAIGYQTVSVGVEYIEQNAVLVQYNATTGELEFIATSIVGSNGNANINVRQTGDFLVLTFKTGDITGTGEVQTADALALLRHIAGISELNSVQLFVANGKEGDVGTTDALNILRLVAGISEKI
ncbi:MAG: hypothetical protein FWD48_05945 [Oscillospiraceae bacterium]|nr:hypothetical protein [Oscillospiraceae bacterium]